MKSEPGVSAGARAPMAGTEPQGSTGCERGVMKMGSYCLRGLLIYFLTAIGAVLLSTEVGFPLLEIAVMVMAILSPILFLSGIIVLIVGKVQRNKRKICHGLGLTIATLLVIFGGSELRHYQQFASEKKADRIIETIDKYAQLNGSFPKSLDEVPTLSISDRTTVIGIFKKHKYYYAPVRSDYDLFFYIPGLRIDGYRWLVGWETSRPSWRTSGKVPEFVR